MTSVEFAPVMTRHERLLPTSEEACFKSIRKLELSSRQLLLTINDDEETVTYQKESELGNIDTRLYELKQYACRLFGLGNPNGEKYAKWADELGKRVSVEY